MKHQKRPCYFETAPYVLLIALYLVQIFVSHNTLNLLAGLCALLCLASAFQQTGGMTRALSVILLCAGSLILLYNRLPLEYWISGLNRMNNLIALMVLINLLVIPLEIGNLGVIIGSLFGKIKDARLLYFTVLLISTVLGGFINVAIIPLIYFFIFDRASQFKVNVQKYTGNSLKRGMALALLWTPLGINMAISTEYAGSSWVALLPYIIPLTLIGLIWSWVSDLPLMRSCAPAEQSCSHTQNQNNTQSVSISIIFYNLIFICLIMITVVAINLYTDYGMIDGLILIGLVLPLSWCIVTGAPGQMLSRAKKRISEDIANLKQFFVLLISAGLFIEGLHHVSLEYFLSGLLGYTYAHYSPFVVYTAISLMIALLSVVGLHPIITSVIIAHSISLAKIGLIPDMLALSLLFGGNLSMIVSPFSANNVIISGLIKASPLDISIRWNFVYACCYFLFLPLCLYLGTGFF